MDDIINIFGFVFPKTYFETKFNVKAEDTRNLNMAFNNRVGISDIDKIKKNNATYDIK
jgi:hypothetical protein